MRVKRAATGAAPEIAPKVQADMRCGKSILVPLTVVTSGDSLTQAKSSGNPLAMTVTEVEPG
jgi:hypothetical protein